MKGDVLRISIIGAGVAGLTAADAFVRAGCAVTIHEREAAAGRGCSFYAGGMIAPWCEAESSEPIVAELGREALRYWRDTVPVALQNGSLLVAPARDLPELARFGSRTSHFETCDADRLAALEPDLAGRFSRALFFAEEAHLDPRVAIDTLTRRLSESPRVTFAFGAETADLNAADLDAADLNADWIIDCRGFAARDRLPICAASRARCWCCRPATSPFRARSS